ncbi:MAG: AraC family transcriptional regulator [Bacillota bacterium]|nr:AraC family transcriptional regulator [Bacillota bacterium]
MGLWKTLFYQLINHAPYHLVSDEEKIKRTNRLNRITNYIDENFSSKLLLSDIADHENLSLTYLSHFFKDNFNTTFQNYLMNIRFEKAKQLIVQTEEKLIDICLESGFSDIRYLNRMFFKQYGCTPKEYRKKINSHNDIAASINPLCIQKFFDEKSSLKILMELNISRE